MSWIDNKKRYGLVLPSWIIDYQKMYNNIVGLIKSMDLEYDATEWTFLLAHPAEMSK